MGEHLEYIQKQTRQHKIPQVYKINNYKKLKKYQIIQKKLWFKKLYDRYSKDTINGKSNKSRNWVYSERPLNENQVRIHLEGTYTVAGRVYTPKRNITLNKEVVTLKELDHIIRFAHISYGLYMGEHLPKGNIVINTKDGGKYTLESHKELQKDRENVKINTADIKNVTFKLVKSVNDIEQV